ncbi:MAG: hypothetical protein AMJ90_05825 [candidate division Zixibacteria bacterium SM23_73_2]|nr:MAG: hypothetical protein AMJ90_05825 [candidate division Zixibacteria bacterium SM23_73_2]
MPPDRTIDAQTQKEIIDSVTCALNEIYVFPDVAQKMEKHLRKKYQKKEYKEITSLRDFGQKLTENLQEISKDRHLRVMFMSDEMLAGFQGDTLTDEEKKRELEKRQRDNFCFKEIKLLEGNIGYIDFRCFSDAGDAGPTAVAAMNFLAHTDAIIFDLRQNGGGSPSMIQLISSYFFDEPVHLNSFYIRKSDSTHQFWTQSHVQGPRMTDVDIYVLTSSRTFSGAEEFTYNFKNLKRGTIIGETTGGGAHPVDGRIFSNLNVGMSLPFGRAVNPITGTNWEGTGVEPDIKVPADEAFEVAHFEALKKLYDKCKDEERKEELDWHISRLNALRNPVTVDASVLQEYAGVYGPRKITLENGVLYYQREDNPKYRAIPMGNDTFIFEKLDYFRIQFIRDSSGLVNEIVGLYLGGHQDSHKRDR